MSRFVKPVAFLALLASLVSCGYVGDPLPPALLMPLPVADLAASQLGDEIVIRFTLSGQTSDGLLLEHYGEVDLRIGRNPEPWDMATWESSSQPLSVPEPYAPGAIQIEIDAAKWANREVIIAVRTANPKGRRSEWSNLFALSVVEPLPVPVDLHANQVHEGVRLTWNEPGTRPGLRFRVYRRQQDSNVEQRLGETGEREWIDAGAGYEETYLYSVQAVVPAGDDVAESELTEPVSITPVDVFPPPAPAGLIAIAGLNTIELTWERDADGAVTYRLYRADDGGELRPLGEPLKVPSYSDAAVTTGRRYRYAISAIDDHGNESEVSEITEQVAP